MAQTSVQFFKPQSGLGLSTHACCRACRRHELSPDTEFKSFCLLCLLFGFPLTLASPGYPGLLLLLIFIPEKWPFRWIFTVSLLSHHDCAALGQSCQQNKQVNHREPIPCLSVAPSFASPLKLACPQSSSRDLSHRFLSLSRVCSWILCRRIHLLSNFSSILEVQLLLF